MAHIKNEEQYHALCDRINQLLKVVSNDTPANDPRLLELDVISDMVADYEEEHFPIVPREEMDSLRMSLQSLFVTFPFLNVSSFAKWVGINPSLMRRYSAGMSAPYGKNRELIQRGIRNVAASFERVLV